MRPVAIVGIDCRFPGAPDPAAYWDMLMRSGDGVGKVPRQRWDARDFHSRAGAEGHSNTTEGGFISDPDAFDNEFFTVSPREAAAMDPQQRLLLQCAWRAVEDAGIAPQRLAGTDTGVFVGIMGNEWAHLHMTDYAQVTAQLGSGNGYCMTANRVSYHLDLKGPSLAVDTACSSSLVAVHLACNALLAGECDTAIAAGVNVALTPALGIFYTQAGLSAPDGRCKPFSADADGIGRGEGVGAVVLRRLEDAIADGQPVYAVIRGTAVNQDGRSNGITAPNRWSQQEVLAAAYRRAGVEPSDVVFTEAHGTGTVLGDMIETKALGQLHAGRSGRPLALGSVKGNIGHTEGAAGIAGLIKVALSLHHKTVPASRFAARENPALKLAKLGIRLLKAPLRLRSGPAIGGLSSFGMGGTNAHAVLESAPPYAARPEAEDTGPGRTGRTTGATGLGAGVFTLTAPSTAALRRNLLVQADTLEKRRVPAGPLSWSSNRTKTGHRYRFAVPAQDTGELVTTLREAATDDDLLARLVGNTAGRPQVALLFTGQGSQYPAMTARLYLQSPLYRRFLNEADEALAPHVGGSVRDLLLAGDEAVHRTGWAQPALFAVEYAVAASLGELGVPPALLLGHSVGEYAAAVLAEVFPLEQAARLIAARGALMERLPEGGGMLAVRAPLAELTELVATEPLVGVGAVNGPRATVLSGDLVALGRIEDQLTRRGVRTRRLEVSHAFHSPLMDPMLDRFAALADEIGGGVPKLPVYSTVRGRLLEAEPMDAKYWTEHIGAPVLFGDAMTRLLEAGPTHLVEVGPRPVLSGMARSLRSAAGAGVHAVAPVSGEDADGRTFAEALAELFRSGLDPHWDAVYPQEERQPQRLAPYAFSDAHRFWTRTAVRAAPAADLSVVPDRADTGSPHPREQPAAHGAVLTAVLPTAAEDASATPVARAVIEAVAEVGGYATDEVSRQSLLYEDLGFDSVMIMELKDRLQERLDGLETISVQDLLPRLSSVGDLADYLQDRAGSAVA
ncbi:MULTISPECIES: type I polyketide synthase [Streptomyces]|uniref:Type I polyketide synthase component n=2 Tax=Streptomyces bottropensis TaxID=42235 RepID=M3EHW3_9ACTN|nr:MULTISPECIES: type I polyketide synthase [Streptomyces]EMF55906.1 type I polyketide synthase component [Streptomyces bottropensis ATCC 25435]MZD16453.1 acyltransferase domain-containing protein [Streptomyces sp. SID5476]